MDVDSMFRKDDDKADCFRLAGDRKFKNFEYVKAIESYNMSLCYAIPESPKILSGYLERASVYIQIELFDDALRNIDMGYVIAQDDSERQRLGIKKNKCLESMERLKSIMQYRKIIPKQLTPKLAFAPRRNIPFAGNCLEITENDKFGRHIITTKDLSPGDILVLESPFSTVLDKSMIYKKCNNCNRSANFNLLPCQRSSMAMFCSEACEQTAYQLFYKYECPIMASILELFCIDDSVYWASLRLLLLAHKCFPTFEQMRRMYDEAMRQKLHFNSFQFGTASMVDSIKYILRLATKDKLQDEYDKINDICHSIIELLTTKTALRHEIKSEEYKDLLHQILVHFYYINLANSYTIVSTPPWLEKSEQIRNEKIGVGLYPFTTLINHSCSPNAKSFFVGENSSTYMVYATRPIRAGEQIFICYKKEMNFLETPIGKRKDTIQREYSFICHCDACTHNYPTLNHLRVLNIFSDEENSFLMNNMAQLREGDMEAAKRGLTKYSSMIRKYATYHPSQDMYKLDLLLDQCMNVLYRNRPYLYE